MSSPEVRLSLRVRGDDLDPEEISSLLRCEPTEALRKDEERETGGRVGCALSGVWSLREQHDGNADLDERIRRLLERVSGESDTWTKLSDRYFIEIFVGVFLASANQGFRLSSQTVALLASRHVSLAFDVYGN